MVLVAVRHHDGLDLFRRHADAYERLKDRCAVCRESGIDQCRTVTLDERVHPDEPVAVEPVDAVGYGLPRYGHG